jgi:uncharacterized protein YjbI with pentapeptide repeats
MLLLENKPNIIIPNYKEHKEQFITNTLLRYTNICQDIINCIIIPYTLNDDLIGINLSHCEIYNESGRLYVFDTVNINIREVYMRYSNLSQCNMNGLDISYTDFSYSNLDGFSYLSTMYPRDYWSFSSHTKFNNCSMINSMIYSLPLDMGEFKNIQIRNSDLRGTKIKYCRFSNCDFSGTDLRGIILYRTIFSFCNFDNCDMRGVNLQCRWLYNSTFNNTNLEYADMRNITVPIINLRNAKLTGAKTNNKDMHKAYLEMSYVGPI